MDDDTKNKLLVFGLVAKRHFDRYERQTFWMACAIGFLSGVVLVENIALAYFGQTESYNSPKNTAQYSPEYGGARGYSDEPTLQNKGGQSSRRSFRIGKHGEGVVAQFLEVADNIGVIGDFHAVDDLVDDFVNFSGFVHTEKGNSLFGFPQEQIKASEGK